MHHAAEAVFIELAHGAAGEHGHFVRARVLENLLPGQAGGAQGVGRGDHRQLQAAWVKARVVQLFQFEAAGQLAGGFHRQRAVAVDLEVATVVQGDFDLRVVQVDHAPVGWQRLGKLLAQGGEARLADREVFLPVGGVDVEVAFLDSSHQGAGKNLCTVTRFDVGRGEGFAVVADQLAVDHLHQLHHYGQAEEGLLTRLAVEGFEHRTAETMVERTSARGVVATETDDDG